MSTFRAFSDQRFRITAERLRMDTIANNLANAETTRTPEGGLTAGIYLVFAPEFSITMRRHFFRDEGQVGQGYGLWEFSVCSELRASRLRSVGSGWRRLCGYAQCYNGGAGDG